MKYLYNKGHKLKLKMTEENRGQVWLDDEELHGVVRVKLEASADDVARASLELLPGAVEIEGEFEIDPWFWFPRRATFDCVLRDRWEAAVNRAWFALRRTARGNEIKPSRPWPRGGYQPEVSGMAPANPPREE